MLQTLSNQRFPPTHIAQLSGHNNINSIENYRSLSKQQQQQQQSMSNMLANISCEKAVSLPKATANNPLPLKMRTLAQPRESSSVTAVCWHFFSEAVIQRRQFSVTINTKNSTTRKPAVERTACTKSRSNETQAHVLRITKTMVLAYAKGLRLTQSTTPQSTPLRSRQNFPTGSKSSLMNQYLK